MFIFRSVSMSGDATAVPPPATSSPRFPNYLLPTFAIPFRRRRQSSTTTTNITTTSYYGSSPTADAVPSLSSTPTSSALSSPVESPPTPSLFPSFRAAASTEEHSRRDSVEPLELVTTKLAQTQPDTIRCSTCAADFAFCSQIVSKGFTGRFGRAYLVSAPVLPYPRPPPRRFKGRLNTAATAPGDLTNIKVGQSETRLLVTGSHVVADITCAICYAKVGWKYVDAKEESQKYKVGKFILETQRCVDHRSWEDALPSELPEIEMRRKDPLKTAEDNGGGGPETIVFDSDDEEECDELFSGTWDPEVVAWRRSRKVNQRSARG